MKRYSIIVGTQDVINTGMEEDWNRAYLSLSLTPPSESTSQRCRKEAAAPGLKLSSCPLQAYTHTRRERGWLGYISITFPRPCSTALEDKSSSLKDLGRKWKRAFSCGIHQGSINDMWDWTHSIQQCVRCVSVARHLHSLYPLWPVQVQMTLFFLTKSGTSLHKLLCAVLKVSNHIYITQLFWPESNKVK